MKLKHFILATLIVALSLSCAHYTIEDAHRRMDPPPSKASIKETRFRLLEEEREQIRNQEERKKEAERARREAEEERERQEAIRNAINEYPEAVSDITFPHLYRPIKEDKALSDDGIITLRTLMLPLGEETLSDEVIDYIKNGLSDLNADIISLTGSLENQRALALSLQRDAITLSGGTIITPFKVSAVSSEQLTLAITETRSIALALSNTKPIVPSSSDEVRELLSYLTNETEQAIARETMLIASHLSSPALFFLSDQLPSSTDWQTFTALPYREERLFATSESLKALSFKDAYEAMRYNTETAPGITRRNGEVAERLDFIYEKGLMTIGSETVQFEGLTDIYGITAIIADFIIP